MKLPNWLKRRKMPRSKAQVQELFEAVGITETPEWQTIESHFADCELPPPELINAAYRLFQSANGNYINSLMQQAYTTREEIVTTITSMMPEGKHD